MTWPNGSQLWGTTKLTSTEEMSSVLTAVSLTGVRLEGAPLQSVRLENGFLAAPDLAPDKLTGAIFQGKASDGSPVEVAVCGAEPSAQDSSLLSYRIEIWSQSKEAWENPCIATQRMPNPKALAVQSLWDKRGASRDEPGKFTFACETGAIAKCIHWGYKPWATKDGQPLKDLHQACTRMVRADYCGDGQSHTRQDQVIDMYDAVGIQARTTVASAHWVPSKASFEAAWTPEGASCLARTRDGQEAQTVLKECPGRFEVGERDLGEGDHCAVRLKAPRAGMAALRNHSYGPQRPGTATAKLSHTP
ncbi:ADYC domain-containing protein [Stigmatella hybrida]|uniref:ADYC domain-containing protein n=1 Tax=Stigmatella hybrida TaxID=394097 RepID=UPI001CDAE2B0|nr:ADYC domain-containing protein [Stigmatella hybrida]